MVPHLVTALTGPINELEQRILESTPAIERWFRLEWMEHTPAFYASVDIRNAGYKLTPVDTDLFPTGFNHLTPDMLPLAVQAAMAAIEKICPEARNLLLIPEPRLLPHAPYLTSVQRLIQIFTQAGLNVRLGALDPKLSVPLRIDVPEGAHLMLEPMVRTPRRLGLKHFDPCTILLNTDLSAGTPAILQGLHEQYLLPPLHAGWGVRRKSQHFQAYEEVAKKFAKLLGMDPWLINPLFTRCDAVDASTRAGIETLQTQADALLAKIRRKHKEYGIAEKPFVVIKADDGTHGARVLTVRDAKELDALTSDTTALPLPQQLIIQEGVPTYERVDDAVAEPVVYTLDRYVVGGFYRVHAERAVDENLNAPGAGFVPLAFAESHHLPKRDMRPGASAPNRFYMYGVIGRLAMLAAAYELEATDPYAEVYD